MWREGPPTFLQQPPVSPRSAHEGHGNPHNPSIESGKGANPEEFFDSTIDKLRAN